MKMCHVKSNSNPYENMSGKVKEIISPGSLNNWRNVKRTSVPKSEACNFCNVHDTQRYDHEVILHSTF